jgi:predicted nuclease with TOPRIM domain
LIDYRNNVYANYLEEDIETMKELITERLQELKTEYHKGQQQLATLEKEVDHLRGTMFRIQGAIQVLEELLQQQDSDSEKGHYGNKSRKLIENNQ